MYPPAAPSGPNLFVLPMLSFSGDQGPWNLAGNDSNGNSALRMQEHAIAIVNAIRDQCDYAKNNRRTSVEIVHTVTTQQAASKPQVPVPPGTTLQYVLHAIRIGNAAIVNNPCEIFLDFGFALRGGSNAPITFLAQLSSDDVCRIPYRMAGYFLGDYPGYVPSASTENEQGVYSERSSEGPVSAVGGQQMVESALTQINTKLFPKLTQP
jgi:hypothetical protein